MKHLLQTKVARAVYPTHKLAIKEIPKIAAEWQSLSKGSENCDNSVIHCRLVDAIMTVIASDRAPRYYGLPSVSNSVIQDMPFETSPTDLDYVVCLHRFWYLAAYYRTGCNC